MRKIVHICDRCGGRKEYECGSRESITGRTVVIKDVGGNVKSERELCGECANSYAAWFSRRGN